MFAEGLLLIKRISDSTVKFARSKSNIYQSKFVSLSSATTVTDNKITPYAFNGKKLESQKLLREVSEPTVSDVAIETLPGRTGLFINGVELLNYKANEFVNYGQIEKIDVIAPGIGYGVINPPLLSITDSVGTGATGYVSVSGVLDEIRVIDGGFDYEGTPGRISVEMEKMLLHL